MVINDTDFLIKQIRDTTNTWDKMANSLRIKWVRRSKLGKKTSSEEVRANNAYNIQQQEKYANDVEVVKYYINAVKKYTKKDDWNV